MRIAVPISNGKLSPHFGHCEQFALIDVDEAQKAISRKVFVASPPHQPEMLPVWLTDQGVSLVIASGMGGRAIDIFRQNRIEVVLGAPDEEPEKVVLDYLQGNLVSGANVCDHDHDHDRACDH